jgi:hypothetical protein
VSSDETISIFVSMLASTERYFAAAGIEGVEIPKVDDEPECGTLRPFLFGERKLALWASLRDVSGLTAVFAHTWFELFYGGACDQGLKFGVRTFLDFNQLFNARELCVQ